MRFIYTITPGRSGQASLTDLVQRTCPNTVAAFEEPQVRFVLPRVFSNYERRFRRRFVETHELLGRGKVLSAFDAGDEVALRRFSKTRYDWMLNRARGADVFFDISKYFVRGLHFCMPEFTPDFRLVFLVRDPILNMRSFVNRGKDFFLDNNQPSSSTNALPMKDELEIEHLYFWAWTEGYLRGLDLAEKQGIEPLVIRTADLDQRQIMVGHFEKLGLPTQGLSVAPALNTNVQAGHRPTQINRSDLDSFQRFRDRVPASAWDRLTFMKDYDPKVETA